jgi:D-threo-aldose 1-dehydrogenase
LRAAALQFPLRHPVIACVLVGMRSPSEVSDAVEMLGFAIPDALWHDLETAGLIR